MISGKRLASLWAIISIALLTWCITVSAHDGQLHDKDDALSPSIAGLGAQSNRRASPPLPDTSEVNSPEQWRSSVLDAMLTDQFGMEFSLSQLNGKPVLLNFFFADCVSVCSRQLYELGEVFEELSANNLLGRFAFVSVTINPDVDTADKLLQVAKKTIPAKLTADNRGWYFVGGDMQEVNSLGTLLGYGRRMQKDGELDHRTNLYLLNHSGELVQQYRGIPVNQSRLVRELGFLASHTP